MQNEESKFVRKLATGVVAAVALLAAVTGWLHGEMRISIRARALAELEAIGKLKSAEVSRWRWERLADARALVEDPVFQAAAHAYFRNRSAEHAAPLLARMQVVRDHCGYGELLIVDSGGRPLLSTSAEAALHGPPEATIRLALSQGKPMIADVHLLPDRHDAHLGVIAPVPGEGGDDASPVFAVVLVNTAADFLYPMLQTWPRPSSTAETILLGKQGGDLVCLNAPRHRPGAPARVFSPTFDAFLSSALAKAGQIEIPDVLDARGESVLAYCRPVEDSPWFLLVKQDATEVFADWHVLSRTILLLFVAAALGIAALALAMFNRERKHRYCALYESESRLRASLEKHRITLKAIGDAVIATDREGRVEFMNPVAETLTGWTNEQACGRLLREVFHIVNEQTRSEVESPVDKALREGGVVGLANHTVLIARDGSERPIADSAAPIHDDAGQIAGVVMVFRDQTLEQNYKQLFRQMLSAFASHEIIRDAAGKPVNYRFLDVNPAFERMTGLKARDVVGHTVLEVLPDTEPDWIARYGHVAETGEPVRFESFSRGLGRTFTVTAYRIKPGQFATIFADITAIKEAEERQRVQNEELRRFNQLATGRELRMIELKQEVNELSRKLGIPPPYSIEFLQPQPPPPPLPNPLPSTPR